MNPRKRKNHRPIKESPFMHLWPELAFMPPLNHWTDRSQPFSPEQSGVLHWLTQAFCCDIQTADKIFQSARSKGILRFNPVTKLWCGVKGGQP